jgi:HD-GYP domain-containing protein (c-di-GMP phosphodiesterase class II)
MRDCSTGDGSPRVWQSATELIASGDAADAAAMLLVDGSTSERASDLRDLPEHVVVVATDAEAEREFAGRVDASLAGVTPEERDRVLDVACRLAATRLTIVHISEKLDRADHESRELARVGSRLMMEHDRSTLLNLILTTGKQLTHSDGAGLLLVKPDMRTGDYEDTGEVEYLYPVAYNFGDIFPQPPTVRFAIDDTTIVGHSAKVREPVVIADAHSLPPGSTFVASKEIEARYHYWVRPMLVMPMIDHLSRVLGVLVFVNRKTDPAVSIRTEEDAKRYTLPYTDRDVNVARSLANQAALSIENARLYIRIERIFENFLRAAVSAIDMRDPTTAGHSLRVAALATSIAEAVNRADGPFRDVKFTPDQLRELRFAALLHDIGKIAVREDVLMKAKKLPPALWERVDSRFDLIRSAIQTEHYKGLVETSCENAGARARAVELAPELTARLEELDRQRNVVRAANEPTVVGHPPQQDLVDIAARTFEWPEGTRTPYLTADELHYLQVSPGTLDATERAQIESHVDETRRLLTEIPWTDDLKDVVTYAYGHHEKLNGTGYPRKLQGDQIPIQTRIITMADIYDALTESDRPYKPALPPEKALEIMEAEATKGLLDHDLLRVMIDSGVYRNIQTDPS